ncbi:MAG: CRISPR system precrRNA processing endoribonuclease RAMP protein Cas6 [Gallionella sp.]|jgi:hypothetical protein
MGKVLGGFFEGAIRFHAPQLEGVLRPNGLDGIANFSIIPPAIKAQVANTLQFGIMLHGEATKSWADIAIALHHQQHSRIHGRCSELREIYLQQPANESARYVMKQGKFLSKMPELDSVDQVFQLALSKLSEASEARIFQLTFHAPLRIASHAVKGVGQQLPWPTLGAVLESIATHLRIKQPDLAEKLGIDENWKPSVVSGQAQALCFAADPARQIECDYPSSTARPQRPDQAHRAQRPKQVRGIIGTLLYTATGDKQEQMLLYWGQWTGVGQKTTAGFGSYTFSFS